MTLIEGIGDEVTHFFIAVFAIAVVMVAWWTTNISEQRHIRTVLLLERRRHRFHRRLTNHTESATITTGTSTLPSTLEEPSSSTASVSTISSVTTISTEVAPPASVKPPEDGQAQVPEIEEDEGEVEEVLAGVGEEQNIIETMDADANELRQRRLAFYNVLRNRNEEPTTSSSNQAPEPSAPVEEVHPVGSNKTDNFLDASSSADNSEQNKSGITIKLKYINDDLKLVDGRLDELLGDFKRRHFQPEISQNKLVRLIFNGQVLQPDSQTLRSCGLFHNCVVHCLVHQKKQQQTQGESSGGTRAEGYSFQNSSGLPHLNNNNQNRDWDLGNFLFAFISFILLGAWYFR
ncbi:unnamed protein product, partial [Callosobruchus maculatus]